MKRSSHVALLLMGTLAIGGGGYALMPGENCQPGMAAPSQPGAECAPRGSTSGGSGGARGSSGGTSSRSNFFGGGSTSNAAVAGTASDSGSGNVTRGGFGSFARSFSAHFSGGG